MREPIRNAANPIFVEPQLPAVIGAIREKWESLGGRFSFLGDPLTDELPTPDGVGRFNRFQGGMIYWTPETGAHEIHGAILARWEQLGFEQSFLGYPVEDETDFPLGGRISSFQHGAIYWWPDTGAIELNDVVVHYTGLICFGKTDGPGADEPYVVIGAVSPSGTATASSNIYEGVEDGDSRPDLIEVYRGKPGGLALGVALMEHDAGDPDRYREAMQKAVGITFDGLVLLVSFIPAVGPIISSVADPILEAVAPIVGAEFNRLLGAGDDQIGKTTIALTAKDMVLLAARTDNTVERGVGFRIVTPMFEGHGASYKVHFGIVPA